MQLGLFSSEGTEVLKREDWMPKIGPEKNGFLFPCQEIWCVYEIKVRSLRALVPGIEALCLLKLFLRNKFVIFSFDKKQSAQSMKCSLEQQKHKALRTTTSDVSYMRYNTVASNLVSVVNTQACSTVKKHFDGGKTVLKVYQYISQLSHLPRKLFPFRCS